MRRHVLVALLAVDCVVPRAWAQEGGGDVRGHVAAQLRGTSIRIPDVTVFLESVANEQAGPKVVTDHRGRFALPRHPAGQYRLCVEAPGFVPHCETTPIYVGTGTIRLSQALMIAPAPGVLRGRVLLADGKPCFRDPSFFGPATVTRVQLVDEAGASMDAAVVANSTGQYVLPRIAAPGSFTVRATCANARAARAVTLTPNDLAGVRPFDLTLPNASPRIASITLRNAAGAVVRHASPGDVLDVTVAASDPNGDALHYTWSEASGNSPMIKWKLPHVPAVSTLFVEVSDGKGGFASSRVAVATGPTRTLFAGRVSDRAGAPLPGVTVNVNGARATTDAEGNFRLEASESKRYVVGVKQPGYALVSRVFYGGVAALDLGLDRAQRDACDPAARCTVSDERGRARVAVTIEPNSVVDSSGAPVGAPFFVEIHGYDLSRPDPTPGDFVGVDGGGRRVPLIPRGAMHLEITDGAGNPLRLRPGAQARLALESDIRAPTLPLVSYDDTSGLWKEEGVATRAGNGYEATIGHLSVWAIVLKVAPPSFACIKILARDVDTNHRAPRFPFTLHVSVKGLQRDFPVTEEVNALLLPYVDTPVILQMRSLESATVLNTLQVSSGGKVDPDLVTWPYDACRGSAVLTLDVPTPYHPFLSEPAYEGSMDDSDPIAYYKAIGALDDAGNRTAERGNLSTWKTTNGFGADPKVPAPGEVTVVYYNNNMFQLALDAHCRQIVGDIACYMTTYPGDPKYLRGVPDSAIADAIAHTNPSVTLAMEYSRPPIGNTRIVKFYAFGAEGGLATKVALDTDGAKNVPNACLACHWTYAAAQNPDRVSMFLPFDPFGFVYDKNPLGKTLHKQVEKFSTLDAMVKATNPDDAVISLIDGLFPQNMPPNADYVPPGWRAKPTTWHAPWSYLYQSIVKPYCLSCHVAQYPAGLHQAPAFNDFDFRIADQWVYQDKQADQPRIIKMDVCSYRDNNNNLVPHYAMPHAEAPFLLFWQKRAYDILSSFLIGLGYSTAFKWDNPCPPSP